MKGSPKPKRKTGNGRETFEFLSSRAELESEHRKKELKLTCYTKTGN